jgi:NAD-dependent oxidoreductase involved in siderophore biosynthesis
MTDATQPAIPSLTKAGAAAIAAGLLLDLAAHSLAPDLHDAVVAGFSVGEHAAHLVVLVGMVMVLAGIVADGTRTARRLARQEGSPRNAVR